MMTAFLLEMAADESGISFTRFPWPFPFRSTASAGRNSLLHESAPPEIGA
jgi:hypothetical protein